MISCQWEMIWCFIGIILLKCMFFNTLLSTSFYFFLVQIWVFFWNCSIIRASPPVLSMWPCTEKLDEEKSRMSGVVQENGGFSRAYLLSFLRLVKSAVNLCTAIISIEPCAINVSFSLSLRTWFSGPAIEQLTSSKHSPILPRNVAGRICRGTSSDRWRVKTRNIIGQTDIMN